VPAEEGPQAAAVGSGTYLGLVEQVSSVAGSLGQTLAELPWPVAIGLRPFVVPQTSPTTDYLSGSEIVS